MGVAAKTPMGGISAQIGERSYPLLLRNSEIERFEAQHNVGIFAVLDQLISNQAQARHIRDLVALGLIGGGLRDAAADLTVNKLDPHWNMALRGVARDLVMAAFIHPDDLKKNGPDGSGESSDPVTDTTLETNSKAQSSQD